MHFIVKKDSRNGNKVRVHLGICTLQIIVFPVVQIHVCLFIACVNYAMYSTSGVT